MPKGASASNFFSNGNSDLKSLRLEFPESSLTHLCLCPLLPPSPHQLSSHTGPVPELGHL